jgi:hypothetical protein
MLPAPIPNEDETGLQEDRFVADPLSDELLSHWDRTASSNTRIFTEVFKPVPANEVRTWDQYKVTLADVGFATEKLIQPPRRLMYQSRSPVMSLLVCHSRLSRKS